MKTWTEEETQTLIDNYSSTTNSALEALIPNKSAYAIYKKAYKIGLRKSPEMERKNRSEAKSGEKAANWAGGTKTNAKGYRLVLCKEHQRADSSGYVLEHILVWERETGISVPTGFCIHHLNGNKGDNRIENLCLMISGAHTAYHHTGTFKSDVCKQKLSCIAKERLSDKHNHPSYKEIDISEMVQMREPGISVSDICSKFGICRRTYYNKLEELNHVS